jgi:hypothetical protein
MHSRWLPKNKGTFQEVTPRSGKIPYRLFPVQIQERSRSRALSHEINRSEILSFPGKRCLKEQEIT